MTRLKQGSKKKLAIVSLGLCILRTWTLGSPEYERKRKKTKQTGRDPALTFDWWSWMPYRRMFRSLAAEAASMIAVGSAAPPLTDGSSDALKYTYQNKGHSAQSGKKKNVLANNKDLLPEQQSCPLFFDRLHLIVQAIRLNVLHFFGLFI